MVARNPFLFMLSGMRSALILTMSRVFLGPIFVVLNLFQKEMGVSNIFLFWILLGILIFSELSDVFDGVIARRTNQVTDLGKLLDPMADSIFRMSVFFSFTQGVMALPLLWVLLLFYRDCLVGAIRNLCAVKGFALAARASGKIKAIVQAVSSFLIVVAFGYYAYGKVSLDFLNNFSHWVIGLCAVYALASGIEYVVANRNYIRSSIKI